MNKYFYTLLTAATLLTAVSCSPIDELFSGEDGDAAKVSFTICAGQIQGRSAGDGNTVDQVHYEVWYDGRLVLSSVTGMNGASPVGISSGMANVNMRLVKGVSYDIAFWAHHAEGTAYDVSNGLEEIRLNKDTIHANRESYDAFYNFLSGYQVSQGVKRVELRRPFGQVNVGTTPEDWQKAEKLGVVIDRTTVTVKGVPNVFNARTGAVTREEGVDSITYRLQNVLQENFDVDGKTFRYLSMNYLLAGEKDRTLHNMSLELHDGNRLINTLHIVNMPVQRNWRTNIFGNVLTSKEDFRIVIEPGFTGDHNENIEDVEKQN